VAVILEVIGLRWQHCHNYGFVVSAGALKMWDWKLQDGKM